MRQLVENLDAEFAEIHRTSFELISTLSAESLYQRSAAGSTDSCGEQVLRCAAAIEQSFGGLTANLWDDPFEWTLPETLSTPNKVLEYLGEVEDMRNHSFRALCDDADLAKEIVTPVGRTQILAFLLDTLNRARHHQQRAIAAFELVKTEN
jgi:hypothetical protein